MFIRKIVQAGLASFTIALPKEWIVKYNLKKGENLYIHELKEGLLISPKEEKEIINETSITINIEGKKERQIVRDIYASYLNNYNQIILKAKNISNISNFIRESASSLIGLEVIEEDTNKIVLRSYVHLTDSEPNQILRRIDNIIRSMIIDSKEVLKNPELVDSFKDRDMNINRFVFLLIKVTKVSLKDPNIARKLNLTPTNALFLWEASQDLEKIGDNIKRYVRCIKGLNKKIQEDIENIINESYKIYIEAMNSFYNKNIESADFAADTRRDIYGMCLELERKVKNLEVHEFTSRIKAMLSAIANITRFARYTQ